jgi:hypothetical protein
LGGSETRCNPMRKTSYFQYINTLRPVNEDKRSRKQLHAALGNTLLPLAASGIIPIPARNVDVLIRNTPVRNCDTIPRASWAALLRV